MKRLLPLFIAALIVPTWALAQTPAPKPAVKASAKASAKSTPKSTAPAVVEPQAPKTPLLTREELRACNKMVDENMVHATAINSANAELGPELDELNKVGADLKLAIQNHKDGMARLTQERAGLVKAAQELPAKTKEMDKEEGEAAVAAHNAKAAEFTARADDFNKVGTALNVQVAAHGERVEKFNRSKDDLMEHEDAYKRGMAAWRAACADRRYDEADEKAIKEGK